MEIPESNQDKEVVFNVTLGKGQVGLTTQHFKDKLDCIIVDSNEKIEIIVESELGYTILFRPEHIGVKYYAVRANTTTAKESLTDIPSFVKYNLNEKLNIILRGRRNEKVKLILRFD